ncbi:hypothetical protein FHW69_003341 [Luteibacter sp. Sphag1AF]|nr:hypothetical protein [Luteibacter sp. Sphag1AF]
MMTTLSFLGGLPGAPVNTAAIGTAQQIIRHD